MARMNAIQTKALTKSYANQEVLHGIDLSVKESRLVGFLGPNGAGKTTAIRILLGLIRNWTGTAQIFGQSCRNAGKTIRRDVGYLAGEPRFYMNMDGRCTLRFLASARGRTCDAEIERLGNLFNLELDKTVRKYSSGMKQKLGLIAALMHRPKLLILDEPTNGLDPLVRKSVFDELRSAVEQGRTVLFSSHTLSEVQQLCDEIIILRAGKIVEHRQIEVLQARALRRVEIEFSTDKPIPKSFPGELRVIKSTGHTIEANWMGKTERLLHWLAEQSVDDVTIQKPNLEDLFMTYYSGNPDRNSIE